MDLVVQTTDHSSTTRLVRYFHQQRDNPRSLHVYPEHFAASAEVLGPCSSHFKGPCLALFRGMQLSPEQVNTWLTDNFIERPVVRLYWLQQDIPAQPDRQSLIQAIISQPLPEGVTGVRLDAYPRTLELELGTQLQEAGYTAPLQPRTYSHVLFMVRLPESGCWRWSYIHRDRLWRHYSNKPAHFDKSVATAINKIAEAVQVLGLSHHLQNGTVSSSSHGLTRNGCADLQQQQQQLEPQQQQQDSLSPPEQQQQQQQQLKWAIDVGASPGGWTSYLADSCGYHVLAIDPAELHPDVVARPGVHHLRCKSQDALQQVDELMQGAQADLLVCDANDHVRELPSFLGPVLPKLKSGAWLVVTLKFYGRGDKGDDVEQLMAKTFPEFEQGTCVWLVANTLCERTYVARKK